MEICPLSKSNSFNSCEQFIANYNSVGDLQYFKILKLTEKLQIELLIY